MYFKAVIAIMVLVLCLMCECAIEQRGALPKPSPLVKPAGLNIDPSYIWIEPIPEQDSHPYVCHPPPATMYPQEF